MDFIFHGEGSGADFFNTEVNSESVSDSKSLFVIGFCVNDDKGDLFGGEDLMKGEAEGFHEIF